MNEQTKEFLRQNWTAKYIETVKYLERLYDYCNEKLFNNELDKPVITVQLNRPIREIASTMIHEMCHYYAELNNMQDTSRSGTYHNKLFKRIAEQHGLKVECVKTIGWSHTELTPETDVLITAFVEHNPETIIYRAPVFTGQMVKTSSTRKYICPVCGQSVRATKAVNIMCADCNELMQEE